MTRTAAKHTHTHVHVLPDCSRVGLLLLSARASFSSLLGMFLWMDGWWRPRPLGPDWLAVSSRASADFSASRSHAHAVICRPGLGWAGRPKRSGRFGCGSSLRLRSSSHFHRLDDVLACLTEQETNRDTTEERLDSHRTHPRRVDLPAALKFRTIHPRSIDHSLSSTTFFS